LIFVDPIVQDLINQSIEWEENMDDVFDSVPSQETKVVKTPVDFGDGTGHAR